MVLLVYIACFIQGCVYDKYILDVFILMSGFIIFFVALIFLIVGIKLLSQMKTQVPEFYKVARGKVLLATLVLSISMMIRAITNITRYAVDFGSYLEESSQ